MSDEHLKAVSCEQCGNWASACICDAPSSLAAPTGSADYVRLPNETKIRFFNAVTSLLRHSFQCDDCSEYIESGDGDCCEKGKHIIATELAFADTGIEFPPNSDYATNG